MYEFIELGNLNLRKCGFQEKCVKLFQFWKNKV